MFVLVLPIPVPLFLCPTTYSYVFTPLCGMNTIVESTQGDLTHSSTVMMFILAASAVLFYLARELFPSRISTVGRCDINHRGQSCPPGRPARLLTRLGTSPEASLICAETRARHLSIAPPTSVSTTAWIVGAFRIGNAAPTIWRADMLSFASFRIRILAFGFFCCYAIPPCLITLFGPTVGRKFWI
ncbi:hypothetical protein BJV77DRAFT_627813 [Russula vinacea]|nr:hypothetical protein BJV77DRAFT_627813 [Russula vinacea]